MFKCVLKLLQLSLSCKWEGRQWEEVWPRLPKAEPSCDSKVMQCTAMQWIKTLFSAFNLRASSALQRIGDPWHRWGDCYPVPEIHRAAVIECRQHTKQLSAVPGDRRHHTSPISPKQSLPDIQPLRHALFTTNNTTFPSLSITDLETMNSLWENILLLMEQLKILYP